MQQSELRERIEGRRLDLEAAAEFAKLPYDEFFKAFLGRSEEPTSTMTQALLLRVIELHYANKTLQADLDYLKTRML